MSRNDEATDRQRPVREDLGVPLVDEDEAGRIYHPSIHRWTLLAAVAGAIVLGWLGYALAAGPLPVSGLGQWAVGGPAVGAFTGAGIGAAAGGLAGALGALYRLPTRHQRES